MSSAAADISGAGMVGAIDGPEGFVVGPRIEASVLETVTAAIEDQWLGILRAQAPEHASVFAECGIGNYHQLAARVDHKALWPKAARILGPECAALLRGCQFFRELVGAFGAIGISAEEGLAPEEVYWRLVRPHCDDDVGPMHADRWFWDLGHGQTPAGSRRIKLWVPVLCESGRNGLLVSPGSHRRDWRYHGELRDGMLKPVLDEDPADLDMQLLPSEPGDTVLFHDQLLHGGAANRGERTRVSFECTLLIPSQVTPL